MQWLNEMENPGIEAGKPEPSISQKKATIDAKNIAAKSLENSPDITATLTDKGPNAKKAQAKLSANVSSQLSKTAGNTVDPTKAAFKGVDSMIDDITSTLEKGNNE